ncbi:MAG TPA: DUF3667 domain-containing protein [Novosphingobium sp.]|nr:DUF3667 domain-containing protein [Novosphingobium sp.]
MSEIVTAVGDLTHAGLVARAVEPAHGEADGTGHTAEAACLNCGTALVGPHCHQCGQAAHVHRTLGAFFHDLLHGAFHFEGKVWRTLPLLLLRPGRLTREYIDGRRASYVSPIALFLFAVFLMFAAAGLGGPPIVADKTDIGFAKSVTDGEAALARLERARLGATAAGRPTAPLDAQIRAKREELALVRSVAANGVLSGSAIRLSDDVPPAIGKALRHAAANPELFLFKLKNSAYKFSWALIPLSVPFVWLLFPFSRRFGVYDHTVFVTYSLTFMSLLVSLGMIAASAELPGMIPILLLLPAAHMFVHLRGAYGLGLGGAAWRTAALALFAAVALSLFASALIALGIFE